MGIFNKLASLLKLREEKLEYNVEYQEESIKITFSKPIEGLETIEDLIRVNNIDRDKDTIFINYEEIYDLYYDENQKEIDDYKVFKLPELFKGSIQIENINNFIQDKEVKFAYVFKDYIGEYTQKHANIIENFVSGDIKIISKEIYIFVKELNEYNKSKDSKIISQQFEMLGRIKDFSEEANIILNERLRSEEKPIVIDKIKIDLEDDGEILNLFPVFSDDLNVNREILSKLNNDNDIKDFYTATINNKKIKFIMKNKSTIEKIKASSSLRGQERLDMLSMDSFILEDENIDLSIFGPRVIGLGYLQYRSYPAMTNTSDLKWIEKEIDKPYLFCDSEKVELKPKDLHMLNLKLREANENNQEKVEVEFESVNGMNVKTTLNKEQLKNEIIKIENAIVSPEKIKSKEIIKQVLELYDENDEDHIEINGKYIEKYNKNYFVNKLEELKNGKTPREKEKDLIIIENIDQAEYIESDKLKDDKLEPKTVEIPKSLKEGIKLFDYQKEGLHKLQVLYVESKINGFLLCDDMGLGKTLQLLSFLAWLREKGEEKPFLIVAPKILINNWDNSNGEGEVQKFFKEGTFKSKILLGKMKEGEFESLNNYNIIFTTYDTLRINNSELGRINWSVMICDEAQKIKNPFTKVTIAAKAQNANFKIVCSATPIENTLIDLWNLVDYSKPGLLNSLKDFKTEYVSRAKGASYETLDEINNNLASKINDFYIRREKDQLETELPNKTTKIYKKIANHWEVEAIQRLMTTEESPLALINKILSISAHIDLLSDVDVLNEEAKDLEERSTKMKILKNILIEIKEKEEKVIIFTRSIKMQHIIYRCIDKWFNIKANIVNGKVSSLDRRTNLIDEFKAVKGFNTIILSPEVAGFGLTITEANHVIHYTRPWNPAKEDQATDRVYRIGQEKDVTVHYPMISFYEDNIYEYNNPAEYVEDNIEVKNENLSPDEKKNILIARKKNMLMKFFLATEDSEVDRNEFIKMGSDYREDKDKNKIEFKDIENNLIDEYEFEALTALIYESYGYKTFLTTRTNDNGVDVVCVNGKERLLIQCKKVQQLDSISTIKDLLYAKDVYTDNVGFDYNLIVVTNTNHIPDKIKNYPGIDIIDGKKLKHILSNLEIYKDEIDIKNNKRDSFEKIKLEL